MSTASATPRPSLVVTTQTTYDVGIDSMASASPRRAPAQKIELRIIAQLDALQVLDDMPCLVEATDVDRDNFIATFDKAGIAASGDTADEAMRNLCETIEMTYDHLSANEAILSPALKRQLVELRKYVRA